MPDFSTLWHLQYHSPDFVPSAAIVIGIAALIGAILWVVDNMFAPISVVAFGIVGFFGKRGSGKSFGMTAYARRWRHFNPDKPVFTNMEKLVLPGCNDPCICVHVHEEIPPEEMMGDPHANCRYIIGKCKAVHVDCNFAKMKACRGGLIAIDEAGIFISNLNFGNRSNREFARWLVATRHYKVMVLLTAHTPGTINNRLRDVLDQLVEMTSFTTLKLFRGHVYDSGKVYGMSDKKSHTIWIPMLWSVSRSYNTDSLRLKADQENRDIIGNDFEFPWENEGVDPTKSTQSKGTSSIANDGVIHSVGNLPRSTTADSSERSTTSVMAPVDMEYIDATILATLVATTAETWNGRKEKPKLRSIQQSGTRRK